MNEEFTYAIFSSHTALNMESGIANSSLTPHDAFWSNVEHYVLDVDESHLKNCLALILVGARLLDLFGTKEFPLPLDERSVQKIRRVEDPVCRLEILGWMPEEDKPIFLADAKRVLEAISRSGA